MKSEQKLTINKLIANDIINYALDDAVSENYNVSLQIYLKYFDDESQKYILNNLDTIIEDIKDNENVLDLEVTKHENDADLDMIFYTDKLYKNDVEKRIGDTARIMKVNISLPEIQDLATQVIDDDALNDDIIGKLKNFDNERDLY